MIYRVYILFFISTIFLLSCSKEEAKLNLISPEQQTLVFGDEGGVKSLSFYSSTDWEIVGQNEWCSVSEMQGNAGNSTVNITVSPNMEGPRSRSNPERFNIIEINAGGLNLPVTIMQEEQKVFYTSIRSSYEVTSSAQTLEIPVKTNYDDFQVVIPENVDWITYIQTKAVEDKEVVLQIASNPTTEERTGGVRFIYDRGEVSFTIKQEANLDMPISFADNIVKIVCVGRYDTNGDGEVSYREAAQVKSVPVPFFGNEYNKVVTSFDEFQYFTSLTYIPIECFLCSTLRSIVLPKNVETIARSCFNSCTELEYVKLNDGLKYIDSHAFDSCTKLKSIELPSSLNTISNNVFQLTTSLESIAIPASVTVVSSGLLAGSAIKSVTLPSTLQTIGDGAFSGCQNLEELNIPSSVKAIGRGIVSNCVNLSRFGGQYATADGKFLIKDGILEGVALNGMTSCEIPEGVLAIGENVFAKTEKVNHITIPSSVVSIGNLAFAWAVGLHSLKVEAEQPPVLAVETFCENNTEKIPLAKIEVPSTSVDLYKNADLWNKYYSIIVGY